MIYFDNAATTLKKPESVYKDTIKYLKKNCGNPGRSSHKIAVKAAEAVYETREAVANFFSFRHPEQVVFSANATYALNIAIKALINEKCHVIISDIEHNSVLRPINKLKENFGIEYSVFDSNAENLFFEIEKLIRKDTKAIVSSIMSNVDGREISLYALSSIRNKYNIKLIVDASQAAGHKEIKISENTCDALVMPGHKSLFGIQGVGVCIFPSKNFYETIIEGGSGFNSKNKEMPIMLPERLEPGTLPTPSIVSLKSGIEFISKKTINYVEDRISELSLQLIERLSYFKNIKLYGNQNGVISFNFDGIGSERISYLLDKHGVCTRGGFHCAPLAHKTLGTLDSGAVRISLSCMNKKRELDEFWSILKCVNNELNS